MDYAFEKYLRGFFKKYGVNPKGVAFNAITDFDSMWEQLKINDVDLSCIPFLEFKCNLEIIFGFHKNGIDLVDLDDYESKYAMGNPYEFEEGECTKKDLAYEILTKLNPNPDIKLKDIDDKIPGFIKRIYRKGGLVDKLKEDFGLNLNQFTGESYEIEKCKIIYFFYALKYKHLPILQGKKGKRPNVLKFLRNLSMENSGFVRFGYQPQNAKIVQFIKISLETELHIKKESHINMIAYIKNALAHVETAWHDYLDAVVFTIDNGKNIDFNFELRLLESMLHKSHKAIEVNISELSPIETLYFKFLQFVRLGELEDVKKINNISPDAKRVVPSEYVDRIEFGRIRQSSLTA